MIQMFYERTDLSETTIIHYINEIIQMIQMFNERTNSNECSMNELTQMLQIYHDSKEQRTYRSF